MKFSSMTILVAAVLGACTTLEEQGTPSTTLPSSSNLQGSATPSATAPAEGRAAPITSTKPNPRATSTKIATPTKNSVYFDLDKDDIKPEFRGVIEQHAKYLSENPTSRARIEGNADERGSREYNLALGQRRAEAVINTLKLLNVPDSRLEAISYGEERPRRTGHDEPSWGENRRGDFVLVEGGK